MYSATEGYWNGVETKGIGEWIQCRERIPLKAYAQFAKKLTLEKFDARDYARLAKQAGMKYVVITANRQYFSETGSALGTLRIENPGIVTINLMAESINPDDPVGLSVSELILHRSRS